MKVIPTQNFLLVRMHDIPTESNIELPEGTQLEPYGEVILAGPDCKLCKPGDFVLFRPDNYVAGFEEHTDPRFIIPEPAVFAFCDPESTQSGASELKVLKNPLEENPQP